jgi:ribosomal protein S12 methylthiotransferase
MRNYTIKKTKVYFETLGCSKNQVDTETMMGILEGQAYVSTLNPEEAAIIIVNTCGFIESAKEESIETILTLLQHKQQGKCKHLVVTGCLAQRYAEDLKKEMPEIDAILGTTSFDQILKTILKLEDPSRQDILIESADKLIPENLPRKTIGPKHTAFLKIAEGCDNCCTYCIIPKLRGKYRSRTLVDVLTEAKHLVSHGVKELIIIAQDITRYGTDLEDQLLLPHLLDELNKIEGLRWIRLQYAYPDMITPELITAISQNEKVCHYIDIPIQHASDRILKLMNRKTSKAHIESVVADLRLAIPDIAIRTTLIVGFPGETEADFQELLTLVEALKFDRLGVFQYSREEDTPADTLPDHIEDAVKEERYNTLMSLQQGVSEKLMMARIGTQIEVIIEEQVPNEPIYIGRSAYDAPEIDGVVYVHTPQILEIGELYAVKITDAMEYDWIGETI